MVTTEPAGLLSVMDFLPPDNGIYNIFDKPVLVDINTKIPDYNEEPAYFETTSSRWNYSFTDTITYDTGWNINVEYGDIYDTTEPGYFMQATLKTPSTTRYNNSYVNNVNYGNVATKEDYIYEWTTPHTEEMDYFQVLNTTNPEYTSKGTTYTMKTTTQRRKTQTSYIGWPTYTMETTIQPLTSQSSHIDLPGPTTQKVVYYAGESNYILTVTLPVFIGE